MRAGSNQSISDFEQKIPSEPSIATGLVFILDNRKVLVFFLKDDLNHFSFSLSTKPLELISIAK